MEEIKGEEKETRPLMSEEEFVKYLIDLRRLHIFTAVSKFKSVRRAMRRGHVGPTGEIYPKRPFNNSAGHKRNGKHVFSLNDEKKLIYKHIKYGY